MNYICCLLYHSYLKISVTFNRLSTLNNKMASKACNFIKKRLWHRCFPVSFVRFLRTPFLTEHLWFLFHPVSLNKNRKIITYYSHFFLHFGFSFTGTNESRKKERQENYFVSRFNFYPFRNIQTLICNFTSDMTHPFFELPPM